METKNNNTEMNNQAVSTALTSQTFAPIANRFIEASGLTKKQFEKEVSFALQLIHSNKRLAECSRESFLKAVLNIANIGLTLNPVSKYAYLVPRWNSLNKINEACLEPSYVGLVKLLTDSGSVKSITATIIRERDEFQVIYGMHPNIIHKPLFGNAGQITGVYAVATLADGSKQFEVMTKAEVEEIRERSESWKAFAAKKIPSCVWSTDESEMYRKTVIKRIYKYLPKTENVQRIEEAIETDNKDYRASESTLVYIEELVRTSTLTEERKSSIENECTGGLSATRASEIISMLQNNQMKSLKQQYIEQVEAVEPEMQTLKTK